ncbi:MAG: alpha-glucuronidase [Dysgonamonadaceae bacterium]|jgi:alpha-glucuronidase|nr:alpha-glucuronidase [Dysgonamonadaceae bacterium]
MKQFIFLLFIFVSNVIIHAEDGSRLWLRYEKNTDFLPEIIFNGKHTPVIETAIDELKNYWNGKTVEFLIDKKQKNWKDGFEIIFNSEKTKLTARSEIGLLYGAYELLRLQKTGFDFMLDDKAAGSTIIGNFPKCDLRILNHWDNIDGSVERGYAGHSLWKWDELPDIVSPRYQEYARANASIGINGTVLNNVNANPKFISREYLVKIACLADIFRPYGIKVYLSINFSSPKESGGLPTSDPLNKDVRQWWKDKVKEIYSLIPDFGGFLVKANSEGLPGPQDFGRTHADGANMLAEALEPYNGIVMWRAFVYSPNSGDRAKQAYEEFMPLDGKFNKNVIIQVKNGPVDFQPREPYSPLFGAMQKTPLMPELQITQEYLGASNHLVFLASMWKEFFDAARQTFTAIAGVANVGENTNWCGHHFAQANWYAFGRLAWNNQLTCNEIAEEWLRMTFSNDTAFINPVKTMILASHEATVNYMMPLGLNCLFAWDHHYGPEPWCNIPGARADWLPGYYHQADSVGIGFNRTISGSNAVSQYPYPLNELFNNIKTCPENLLLWFHHASWNHQMKSGRILWDELCYKYQEGVEQVRDFQKTLDRIENFIDAERFSDVQYKLKIQTKDAVWWRDACLLYFQTFSNKPIPYLLERPVHDLEEMKKIKLNMKHHN